MTAQPKFCPSVQGVYSRKSIVQVAALSPLKGESQPVQPEIREYERAVYGGARAPRVIRAFCGCGREAICPSKRCMSCCVESCR